MIVDASAQYDETSTLVNVFATLGSWPRRRSCSRRPERVRGCCVALAARSARRRRSTSSPRSSRRSPTRPASRCSTCCARRGTRLRVRLHRRVRPRPADGEPPPRQAQAGAGFIDSFKRGVWAFYRLRADMPAAARAAVLHEVLRQRRVPELRAAFCWPGAHHVEDELAERRALGGRERRASGGRHDQ
jgi:hypothetical protein